MAIVLIDKIAPKNDAFTGMVNADQVLGGVTGSTIPDDALAFTTVNQFTGSIGHNDLSGLTLGDTHTQYLKTDGTRELTGNMSAGSLMIGSLTTPLYDMDASNKKYVDDTAGAPNLWSKFIAQTGSTIANTTTDEFTMTGISGITTSITGDAVTIEWSGAVGDFQNIWSKFIADTGSTIANTTTDEFTITGGSKIITSISSDTITLDWSGTFGHSGLDPTHNLSSDINHDTLTNFVVNKHIDWTNASSHFKTTGSVTGNLTGSVVGDVTGNLTGSVVGDVTGNLTGSATTVNNLSSGCVAYDHGTAATDMIINVCYGTGSAPTANTTTIGTLFIKYTA